MVHLLVADLVWVTFVVFSAQAAAGGRMMDERALRWLLLGAIGSVGLIFAAVFVAGLRRRASEQSGFRIQPSGVELATGFVTVFFDTLGIGSFATTTAIFRAMRLVPDELIPGTLNVGHTLPTVVQAFVFIDLMPVDARHADLDDRRLGRLAPGSARASSRGWPKRMCRSAWGVALSWPRR